MRLSLVLHLLVFVSVLSLIRAETTTASQLITPATTTTTTSAPSTPATTTSPSTTPATTTTSSPSTTPATTTTSAPSTTTATTSTSSPLTTPATTTSSPLTTPATTTTTTTSASSTTPATTTTTSAPSTTPATTTTTTSAPSTTPATTTSSPTTTPAAAATTTSSPSTKPATTTSSPTTTPAETTTTTIKSAPTTKSSPTTTTTTTITSAPLTTPATTTPAATTTTSAPTMTTASTIASVTTALEATSTTTTATTKSLTAPAIFYPFGSAAGDKTNPALDDGSSSVIQLSNPFLFFGRTYQQIYVNNNGLLTFNQSSSAYIPYSFPANRNQDIIAGLWTDLDNRVKGVVSYNQYTSGNVLTNATRDINTYFPKLNFNASWVFVATWNKVAYFNLTSTDTSFQVVLISDRNSSFILMNYGDIAVTEHPVQAGYDTINSTHYFVIPESNRGSFISNLRNSSNVDVPGRWAFMVAGEPDNVIGIQVRLSSFSDLTQSSNIEMVLQQMKQELVKYGLPNSVELKLRKRQKIKP